MLAAALCVGSAAAEVVSKRLATGLPPSPTAGHLPEAWVSAATDAPKLDGRLDDQVWTAARPIVLGKLESYGTTSPRTEVQLIHKAAVLYVGARLAEPRITKARHRVVIQRKTGL